VRELILTPRALEVALTGRCNLSCKYCFYADEMTARSDLTTSQWLNFISQLGGMGVMDLTLTGGEVFTRRDLYELIDEVVVNRMRYSLLTNGTLVTEKTLAQLEQGKRRLRLNSIQVSMDGSRADVHNLSRPNSFDRAVRGLRLLKEANFPVTVRVTINRHNLNDLENIARFLLEEIGLVSFSTNEAVPIGSGCQNAGEVSLTPLEMKAAIEIMSRIAERYPGRVQAQAGPQAKKAFFEEMEHAHRTGEKAKRWQMGSLTGCGCIFSKLSILHDGSIVPCSMMSGAVMGNITKDSLADIWQTHPILKSLRSRGSIAMRDLPGCSQCEWVEFCNGSCPGLAHQLIGDFNQANPVDCYRNYLEGIRR
jgi:SynChlorMet cassette radical SAM/SPASM protein ScmE